MAAFPTTGAAGATQQLLNDITKAGGDAADALSVMGPATKKDAKALAERLAADSTSKGPIFTLF